jgi:hypothetical protein
MLRPWSVVTLPGAGGGGPVNLSESESDSRLVTQRLSGRGRRGRDSESENALPGPDLTHFPDSEPSKSPTGSFSDGSVAFTG